MRGSTYFALLALALGHESFAQQQQQDGPQTGDLITSTLTMLDNSGSTLIATVTMLDGNSPEPTRVTQQQAEPTTTSAPEQPAVTSVIQATRTESAYIPSESGSSNLNADGIDVEAGASGSSSSGFSLSQGGMIAVIVVVVCVAVFGVLSITLFILAKKRQWRVRESIKRASRRLTGRGPPPRSDVERRKRSGVVAGSRGKTNTPSAPRQKGAVVAETEMADLEKGQGADGNGRAKGAAWLGRMRDNNWK